MKVVVRKAVPAVVRMLALGLALVVLPAHAEQQCDTRTAPLSVPSERFADRGEGTLSDRRSQLMWQRCSLGQAWQGGRCVGPALRLTWQQAQAAAQQLNDSGSAFYNDWRVPQLQELAQITERQCSAPRTNLELFPDTPPAPHWTATRRAGTPASTRQWALSFGAEGVLLEDTEQALHVRLVRTGP